MKRGLAALQSQITLAFGDVRFWILLFFILRLYNIWLPPLDMAHNWRQTTVAMVARNFYEIEANPFYPRIDIAGDLSGITGMEFPLLNYLIYLVSLVFGYDHWYGRLINLTISSLGIWFFYLLITKYFNQRTALYASVVLLASIWFAYSRKIMPDTFSTSLIITGLYFGTNYLDRRPSVANLITFFFLVLLGTLSKLPAACLLGAILPLLLSPQVNRQRRINLIMASILAMIPVAFWYFYWVPHLVEEFGFWHFFMGKELITGGREIITFWNESLKNFYDNALKFIGFAAFLLGLFFAFYKKNKKMLGIFAFVSLPYLLIVLKAGQTFAFHSYYIIPFVPVMALLAGYGLTQIKRKGLSRWLLLAIVVEGLANQQHDFRLKEKDLPILELEQVLDRFSHQEDLIAINSGYYPTPMYFAHRRGWVAPNDDLLSEAYRNNLKKHGLSYIVILKKSFGTAIHLPEKRIFDNENFSIYQTVPVK